MTVSIDYGATHGVTESTKARKGLGAKLTTGNETHTTNGDTI